ncbi:hypothetical protein RvY_13419 [Ramazzottius varieornatus]|uniref:Cyclin-like domain-containing protein n=1 Tax=Ramazzottius varieornatus TaxID=947166 RepID=A0A1D1VMU5_RAMVA|nr:hypothetical protein RvY_13419 [Ramazzottius varieornatus]
MVGVVTPTRISRPFKTVMDSDSLKKKSSRSVKLSDLVVKKSTKTSSLSAEAITLQENGKRRREASLSPDQPSRRSSMADQTGAKSSIARTASGGQSTILQSTTATTLMSHAQSTPTSQSTTTLQRTFGHVVISLENLILPRYRLAPTPSMQEGLSVRTEWYLRRLGCDFIQHGGYILKLPQTAMATAQVLYQRFYYIKSFVRNDYLTMGMACVYLSSKVEESPKRLRDIINVFTYVRQVICDEPVKPVILDYGYVNVKNQVIKCERRLLKELGFCVHVKHPHKLIYMYLRMLDFDMDDDVDRRFMQAA